MKVRFAVAFLCVLTACTWYQDERTAVGTIVSPGNFFPGSGVIQSVGVLANARRNEKDPAADPNFYRLYLQMDQGGFQSVDVDNNTFAAGEAVELTSDRRVLRVSGTGLQNLFRR